MIVDRIKQAISEYGCIRKSNSPELYNDVLASTQFLNDRSKIKERVYVLINNITSPVSCKACDVTVKFKGSKSGYSKYCSVGCRANDPDWVDSTNNTNMERYGVCRPAQRIDIRTKMEQTTLKNFGVRFSQQNQQVRDKTKDTNLLKYNSPIFITSDHFKKITAISRSKLGRFPAQLHIPSQSLDKLNDSDWLTNSNNNGMLLIDIAVSLGVSVSTVSLYFKKHNISPNRCYASSAGEREIVDFIKALGIECQTNVRNVISPKELDIYIPSHNIAIEYCGLYWHSDVHDRITTKYHLDKLNRCNQLGISLITIFEDEWVHMQSVVKSTLMHKLNKNSTQLYARSCNVIVPTKQDKKTFFNKYHIQGNGGGSITYSLAHNNINVAMMTFIKRKNKIYELNRFATTKNVPGGFSKLLNHFKRLHQWSSITSFADRRWSDGNVYSSQGFELTSTSKPSYWYIKQTHRMHRANFMKGRLHTKLKNYDSTLTEFENCDNHNILRIWDCGQYKYTLNNTD